VDRVPVDNGTAETVTLAEPPAGIPARLQIMMVPDCEVRRLQAPAVEFAIPLTWEFDETSMSTCDAGVVVSAVLFVRSRRRALPFPARHCLVLRSSLTVVRPPTQLPPSPEGCPGQWRQEGLAAREPARRGVE
jgi:hypothetical protein